MKVVCMKMCCLGGKNSVVKGLIKTTTKLKFKSPPKRRLLI